MSTLETLKGMKGLKCGVIFIDDVLLVFLTSSSLQRQEICIDAFSMTDCR